MAWQCALNVDSFEIIISSGVRGEEFAGIRLADPIIAKAIRERDPCLLDAFEKLLNRWEEICTLMDANDGFGFWDPSYMRNAPNDVYIKWIQQLQTIANSDLAAPEERQRAQDILDGKIKDTTKKSPNISNHHSEHGYVYVLQAPAMNPALFKIGRAKVLNNRIDTLSIKLPWELEIIAHIETDDYKGLETELHQRFADKRDKGEWFRLTEEDIEWIRGLEFKKEVINA